MQQKDHSKQHGLNDLSGCIILREEMLVAILAWKHFRAFTKKWFSNWKNAMEKKKGCQKHDPLIRIWGKLQDMSRHPQQY